MSSLINRRHSQTEKLVRFTTIHIWTIWGYKTQTIVWQAHKKMDAC